MSENSRARGRTVPVGWVVMLAAGIAVAAYFAGNSHVFNKNARWDRERSDLESSLTMELDLAFYTLDKDDRRLTFADCAGREHEYRCLVFRSSGPKNENELARREAADDPSADSGLFDGGRYRVRLNGRYWTARLEPKGGGGFIRKLEGKLIG